ncbi:hypothetical protein JHK82_035336 [Glycine max]|nr:hypothetical protein JHK82_035336 [Glycine max]
MMLIMCLQHISDLMILQTNSIRVTTTWTSLAEFDQARGSQIFNYHHLHPF